MIAKRSQPLMGGDFFLWPRLLIASEHSPNHVTGTLQYFCAVGGGSDPAAIFISYVLARSLANG